MLALDRTLSCCSCRKNAAGPTRRGDVRPRTAIHRPSGSHRRAARLWGELVNACQPPPSSAMGPFPAEIGLASTLLSSRPLGLVLAHPRGRSQRREDLCCATHVASGSRTAATDPSAGASQGCTHVPGALVGAEPGWTSPLARSPGPKCPSHFPGQPGQGVSLSCG